ncbi:MAG: DUF2267 domain-containing protein [Acidobacteriota bacterium]|nr:DUF2267 domain-containing protein [Acidobacteriota bacterium]
MDELVKQVATKTGISEEQARSAVTTVIGFLKDRLPAPIAGQLDNLVEGGGDAAGGLGDLASKVGGIFGK